MASEPKDYTIFILMILTSTENKVQFLIFRIHGKGISVP